MDTNADTLLDRIIRIQGHEVLIFIILIVLLALIFVTSQILDVRKDSHGHSEQRRGEPRDS